jgi:hypothetical protein
MNELCKLTCACKFFHEVAGDLIIQLYHKHAPDSDRSLRYFTQPHMLKGKAKLTNIVLSHNDRITDSGITIFDCQISHD